MHIFSDHCDLRQNTDSQTSVSAIWPSFTDIMTVILMVFMITMVAVIIKNSDLYQQLLQSQNEETRAVNSLYEREAENEDLQTHIADLEDVVHSKEMEIILLNDEMKNVRHVLEENIAIIAVLEDSAREMEKHISEMNELTNSMRLNFERQMAVLSEKTHRQIEELNRRYSNLSDSFNKSKQQIILLNSEKKDLSLTLAKERNTFSVLEKKYNKMIKAARSPVGKKVVTIHYSRKGGAFRILYKNIGASTFETITREQMHSRLRALKEKWQKQLYVKVVIPNKSGLSYNEAWSFTKKILSAYDYYDQITE